MKISNIYKVALISGAMAASGFAFASITGNTGSGTHNVPSNPPTAVEQKGTPKETNDDAIKQQTISTPADVTDTKNAVSDENQKETRDDAVKLPAWAISEDTAKKAVLAAYPKGEIVGVETENEHGTIDYNISLKDGTDVKVDIVKGAILKTDKRDSEEKAGTEKKKTNDDANESSDSGSSETED